MAKIITRKNTNTKMSYGQALYNHFTSHAGDANLNKYAAKAEALLDSVMELESPRREEAFVLGCLILSENESARVKLAA